MENTDNKTQSLLVLCCHPPSIDPRIKWTAEFGQKNDYSTTIAGFHYKKDNRAHVVSASQTTPEKIFTPNDLRTPLKRVIFLMCRYRIWPTGWALLVTMLAAPFAGAFWISWKAWLVVKAGVGGAFRCLRYLPKGQALINYARFYRRQFFSAIGGICTAVWRSTFGGRFRSQVEALRGYYWYFFRHAATFAGCILQEYDQKETAPPSIIHAHDPDALLAAVLMRHRYGCRVVYDAHEYGADAYLIRPEPRYLFHAYERMVVRHADSAVTVSPILAERFNKRFRGRPHFSFLPNASPKSESLFSRPAHSEISRLAQGRTAVLFHGGFAPERGVEWIIDEWALAPPKHAALFIRGPHNAYRKQLVQHARKTALLNVSIYFLDSIQEDLLIAEASAADIGVIPYHSHVENHVGACPNKLSQYMLAGLAIISSPIPFVSEIVQKARCGVIYDDHITGDFSEKLKLLLQNPDEIRRLGTSGRRYAREIYHYENYAQILSDLYENER